MRSLNLNEEEKMVFDVYFPSIASISFHPAAGRSNGHDKAAQRTVEECADIALKMIEVRREVLYR